MGKRKMGGKSSKSKKASKSKKGKEEPKPDEVKAEDKPQDKEDVCIDVKDGKAICDRRSKKCAGDPSKVRCFIDSFNGCNMIEFRDLNSERLPDRTYAYKQWS